MSFNSNSVLEKRGLCFVSTKRLFYFWFRKKQESKANICFGYTMSSSQRRQKSSIKKNIWRKPKSDLHILHHYRMIWKPYCLQMIFFLCFFALVHITTHICQEQRGWYLRNSFRCSPILNAHWPFIQSLVIIPLRTNLGCK